MLVVEGERIDGKKLYRFIQGIAKFVLSGEVAGEVRTPNLKRFPNLAKGAWEMCCPEWALFKSSSCRQALQSLVKSITNTHFLYPQYARNNVQADRGSTRSVLEIRK